MSSTPTSTVIDKHGNSWTLSVRRHEAIAEGPAGQVLTVRLPVAPAPQTAWFRAFETLRKRIDRPIAL